MLNALKMNRKAFTRKENPNPADKNQTLTKILFVCAGLFTYVPPTHPPHPPTHPTHPPYPPHPPHPTPPPTHP